MVSVTFLHRLPDGGLTAQAVDAASGQSLMQAALNARVRGIEGECGGTMVCATCHVYVAPEWLGRLSAPSDDELAMLEGAAAPTRAGSRLACQITVEPALAGLVVEVPERQY